MQRGALGVEENLIEKRARLKAEKRVTYKDETMASTSSSDAKIDNLVRVMEKMLEKINLNDRMPPRENQKKPQNRNRNPILEETLIKIGKETMTNRLGLPFNKTMLIKKKKGKLKGWKKIM